MVLILPPSPSSARTFLMESAEKLWWRNSASGHWILDCMVYLPSVKRSVYLPLMSASPADPVNPVMKPSLALPGAVYSLRNLSSCGTRNASILRSSRTLRSFARYSALRDIYIPSYLNWQTSAFRRQRAPASFLRLVCPCLRPSPTRLWRQPQASGQAAG